MAELPSRQDSRLEQRVGWAILALALAFYLAFAARFPFPNEWTGVMVSLMGLDPFRPLAYPIWQTFLAGLDRIPGLSMPVAANGLNALCTGLSVFVLYRIVIRLEFKTAAAKLRKAEARAEGELPRLVAAVTAALYAVASLPVFVVGTRAHPLGLGTLLFLVAILLVVEFRRSRELRLWYAFALLYGFGVSEFGTFIFTAPLFALCWLWLFLRYQLFSWVTVLKGFLLFLVGFAALMLFCWGYYESPVSEWREFGNYWLVLKQYFADQYRLLVHSFPKLGWLVVLLLMIAPGIVVFTQGFDQAEDIYTRIGLFLFRLIITALAIVPLFDLPGSPWRITGESPLIVTPYFITAMWVGHLVGYAFLAASRLPGWRCRFGQLALAAIVLAVLGTATVRHVSRAAASKSRPVVDYAKAIVDSLEGRSWLVTDGTFDALLQLIARDDGVELHTLNRALGRTSSYLRYVSTQFDDAGLKSVSLVGLQPLVDVWLDRDKDALGRIAALEYPDLWASRGYPYVPHKTVFWGAERNATNNLDAIFAANMAFLKDAPARFIPSSDVFGRTKAYGEWIRRHLGMMANNLGVFMEDGGRTNESWHAYETAHATDPDNISALLNLVAQADREGRSEKALYQEKIDSYVRRQRSPPSVWTLAAQYGYIRDPRFHATEGWVWALTGRKDLGIQRMQEAVAKTGDLTTKLTLARLLVGEDKQQEGVELYESILEKDPNNVDALVNLSRVRTLSGDFSAAEDLLMRATSNGVPKRTLALDFGMLWLSRGETDKAREILLDASEDNERLTPVWLALAYVAFQQKDADLLKQAKEHLERSERYLPAMLFLGDLAIAAGDLDGARAKMEQAKRVAPLNTTVLERLVSIDFMQREMRWAFEHASDLLNLDAGNPLANYVLGVYYYKEGKRDLAEASIRRSLQARVSAPAANDLAWMLFERGRYEEALSWSSKAVAMDEKQPVFWGTHGSILQKLGNRDDAAAAFDRAIFIGLRSPAGLLAAGRVYSETEDLDKVRKIVTYLDSIAQQLTPEQVSELAAIKAKVPTQSL